MATVDSRHHRYEGFRQIVKAVGTGERGRRDLTADEAYETGRSLLAGEVSAAQAGAFLLAMRLKGETPGELAGLARALVLGAPALRPPAGADVVVCSGAYDGTASAPALSLAAGVVAAAAGAHVALHCGDCLGPKYGTTPADVLGALGGPLTPSGDDSERMLAASGITVVHAGEVVRGWRDVAVWRDEIGPRGPLHSAEKVIPWFGATRFVVGYTHAPYRERLLGALELVGARHVLVVRGVEGSDIARPGRPIAHGLDGQLELPEQLGDALPKLSGAAASAELTRAVIGGDADRVTTYTVVLSAALRLVVAGLAPTPLRGISQARAAIGDGRAAATLDALLAA